MVVLSETLYPLSFSSTQPQAGAAAGEQSGPGNGANVSSLKTFLRDQEVAHLNRALSQTGGDKEKAAQLLGISLATLYRKLSEVEESA
jgi:transcriptional regulator with PAS, ATPase and Fis domain